MFPTNIYLGPYFAELRDLSFKMNPGNIRQWFCCHGALSFHCVSSANLNSWLCLSNLSCIIKRLIAGLFRGYCFLPWGRKKEWVHCTSLCGPCLNRFVIPLFTSPENRVSSEVNSREISETLFEWFHLIPLTLSGVINNPRKFAETIFIFWHNYGCWGVWARKWMCEVMTKSGCGICLAPVVDDKQQPYILISTWSVQVISQGQW